MLALPALCEALLLVAGAPTSPQELAGALDQPTTAVEAALADLGSQLAGRGIQLQCHDGRYALVSAPGAARAVARLLGLHRVERLSPAALETLAIVAYRGPVTRGEVEAIRGVDSSGVLHTLAARSLIEAIGRRTTVGSPIEYAVTPAFLRHFGLASLADLPPLGEVRGQAVEAHWDERAAAAETREAVQREMDPGLSDVEREGEAVATAAERTGAASLVARES